MFVIVLHFVLTQFIERLGGAPNLWSSIYTWGMLTIFVNMLLLTTYFLYLDMRNRNKR